MSSQQHHDKPAIILVHGFRGSPIGLQSIGKFLQKAGYQVFTPPIPPFGGAEDIIEYTPKTYADYLARFAHKKHLQKPILIGHSMGSIIAAATLYFYPNVFNHQAVLLSPISARTAKPFRLVAPLSALTPKGVVDYITTRFLFVPHNHSLFRETLQITHRCSNDQAPSKNKVMAAAKFSTKYAVGDFRPRKKILLLAGEKDRLIHKSQTQKLAQELAAEVIFLPNTGHLHNYEQPEETARAIINFLKAWTKVSFV